jgi:hypothetical protein
MSQRRLADGTYASSVSFEDRLAAADAAGLNHSLAGRLRGADAAAIAADAVALAAELGAHTQADGPRTGGWVEAAVSNGGSTHQGAPEPAAPRSFDQGAGRGAAAPPRGSTFDASIRSALGK